MSVFKWIFSVVERIWQWFKPAVQFVHGIFSSVLAWFVAGLVYVVHLVVDYTGDFVENLFEDITDISLTGIDVSPFANWLARVVALDTAWECFVIYLGIYFAVRMGRVLFSAVRLIIDIL